MLRPALATATLPLAAARVPPAPTSPPALSCCSRSNWRLGTGQRKGDRLRLPWTACDGKRLRFRQGKRRRLVDMPVTRAVEAVLDAAPKKATTFLAHNDKPWSINAKRQAIYFSHL